MALRTLSRNNKSCHYEKVRQIMEHFGQTVHDVPTVPDDATRILRARLMLEEPLETIQRGLGVSVRIMNPATGGFIPINFADLHFEITDPVDMVELVDGCFDTMVVTTGTLIACGVPDMDGQDLVDEANLAKMGGGKDEFGKFQKPPGWKPADIGGWINQLEVEAQQFPPGERTATFDFHEEESE
jgi:predicted HAD superfamily Cof-like phosphohydrolase